MPNAMVLPLKGRTMAHGEIYPQFLTFFLVFFSFFFFTTLFRSPTGRNF